MSCQSKLHVCPEGERWLFLETGCGVEEVLGSGSVPSCYAVCDLNQMM